ncbi:MAG: diguanylate cyclase [Nodosilinea sp.]
MSFSPNSVADLWSSGQQDLTPEHASRDLEFLQATLVRARESDDHQTQILILKKLATLYRKQDQEYQAIPCIEEALALALEHGYRQQVYHCHRQLSALYKACHNFEAALNHLEAAEAIGSELLYPDILPPQNQGSGAAWANGTFPVSSSRSDYQVLQVPLLFRNIVEQAQIGVAIFQEGSIVYCNRCFQNWLGFSMTQYQPIRLEEILINLDYQDLLACRGQSTTQIGELCQSEKQLKGHDGQVIDIEFHASVIEFNYRPAVLTFMRNITERKQMENHLKASEARYRSLFDHVPLGLCRFSPEGDLLDANPALVHMFGFSDRASFLVANPLVHSTASRKSWQNCLNQVGMVKHCELELCRRDGPTLWIRVSARAVTDTAGEVAYYEGAIEDFTEIRAAQVALQELAIRDSLTHVYNRRHFFEVTQREMARAKRFNRSLTLLLIDIDHFKIINDTHGHLIGDQVLRDVVLRLKGNLRESDILARYGGEEFIVLMPETNQTDAWCGAERLRRVIAESPFVTADSSLEVTISLGVASWMPRSDTPMPTLESLTNRADQALLRAKQEGRNRTKIAD